MRLYSYQIVPQKLQERKYTLEKGKFTDETSKEEWKNVLTLSCMSSDESVLIMIMRYQ